MKSYSMKRQLILSALLLLAFGCASEETAETENLTEPVTAVPVYVENLSPQTFRHFITVQGSVESDKTILISPKITATVKELRVRSGDVVKKNEILAVLDGEITKSQIKELENQLALATTLFEKQKNRREQNIGSEVEFLQAKTQKESLQNQLSTLNEQYRDYTIRANISGTVDRVMLKEGESVTADTPVFQVANSEALKVKATISEAYISTIDRSDSVTISFPSLNVSFKSKLDVVSKVINSSNRTFAVEVNIGNADGKIHPNMIAKLTINDYSESEQIVVPINAVQKANDENYVFLAKQINSTTQAIKTTVKTGSSYGNQIIITEGLKFGDQLITTGYNNVVNEDRISIKEN